MFFQLLCSIFIMCPINNKHRIFMYASKSTLPLRFQKAISNSFHRIYTFFSMFSHIYFLSAQFFVMPVEPHMQLQHFESDTIRQRNMNIFKLFIRKMSVHDKIHLKTCTLSGSANCIGT